MPESIADPLKRLKDKIDDSLTTTLSGIIEKHHMLPRQFEAKFKAQGLDIEAFVIPLDKARHRLAPDGIHSGPWRDSWNGVWDAFFKQNPNASAQDILDQLANMRRQFGI